MYTDTHTCTHTHTHTHTYTHTYTCRSAAVRTTYFSGLLLRPQSRSDCYSLVDFFSSIEKSNSRATSELGWKQGNISAMVMMRSRNIYRFGRLYFKLNPDNVIPTNSTSQEWKRSKSLRKAAFNTQ